MFKFLARKLVTCVELLEKISPRIHVYHIEDIFVIIVLVTTGIIAGGDYREWIGVLAVFFAFKHTVVAFRLEEVLAMRTEGGDTAFNSHGKQTQYFFMKETLWLIYFVLFGAWSAVVGVVIFLSYPVWHNIREKYHTGTKHLKNKKVNRETEKNSH